MLQLPRQLKPSILTGAGLFPNFTRTQPPPLMMVEEGGGGEGTATLSGIGSMGTKLWLPNWESWIRGFPALVGGDP